MWSFILEFLNMAAHHGGILGIEIDRIIMNLLGITKLERSNVFIPWSRTINS